MELERKSLGILEKALTKLSGGFESLEDFHSDYDGQRAERVVLDIAEKMADNFPYPHPLYAGQMLKPPHPVARTAYMLAMWINPNNHALDGGRASSAMEKTAVAGIAKMFGWTTFMGHLTGGGTLANLEALWVASKLQAGKKIVASEQAHYTHNRLCAVLGIPFAGVAVDDQARMDVAALEKLLETGEVGTVVVTLGTTGTGSVDPLHDVLALKERYDFRIHVDAAYGGYYTLLDELSEPVRAAFARIDEADSIVIDPHKHGLQPYGCGCILFRDPSVGRFYKHDSPYTYFSSVDLHLGEISLECSRAGAAAVALYATMEMLPLEKGGEFAADLGKTRQAALSLYHRLREDERFIAPLEPDLDIVIWAPRAAKTSDISRLSKTFFERAEKNHLYLATFSYPSEKLLAVFPDLQIDSESTVCLRSCLMKPEHLDWLERIWAIIDEVQTTLA
ncbi:MAG: aspartate aminotransferase family protein [Gammaproteobacteria bacterium]|nr:aspartate aminotransferase family protein [Gammaproteobacteria bacterium]